MNRQFSKRHAAWIALAVLIAVPAAYGQRANRGDGSSAAVDDKPDAGIPVTNELVISKCGGCHTKDDKGNLSRISWERSTPEGWEEAIKRMVRLNGLVIAAPEARSIVKYLATYHGLAPNEAKPIMYMAEHRTMDETIIPNDSVRGACTTCHAFGRAMSWRRSREDWKYLQNLHVALYAQADTHFHRPPRGGLVGGGGGSGAGAPATPSAAGSESGDVAAPLPPEPGEAALDYLSKSAALHTTEWAEWRARLRAPRITGRWLVSTTVPGYGKYVGEMMIEPGPVEDEFKTSVTLKSLKTGAVVKRSGTGLVYAGYSWRGRSKGIVPGNASPDDLQKDARETLWISPDQLSAEGRWFWGEYQEFGFDVKLMRAATEPTLVASASYSVKAGTTTRLRILGDSLPVNLTAADVDLGAGVKLSKIISHTKSEIVADITVDKTAVSGMRDIGLGRSILQNAYAVYDKVDYLKVTPETALSRLGSDVHPKGYQQFEAIGYANGADGKPHTADDVVLGPLDVDWSVEEFMAVYGDDDKSFVGHLSETAFFTPASDGPNPERKFSRNNYGDVWVVATAKNEKDKEGKPLTGRSYMVVTVPTYIKWDQPEVSQ